MTGARSSNSWALSGTNRKPLPFSLSIWPFALEGDQRFAQRGAADAELGGELHLVDALAGLHVARSHACEQFLAHLRAKVLAFDRHLSSSFRAARPSRQA